MNDLLAEHVILRIEDVGSSEEGDKVELITNSTDFRNKTWLR